ncbi:MAG: phosphate acyltransferase PlsX [Thiothrix sp.]|nr:MAG: phosphate acyltransferase PlsX [Thiothrix sp.]
MSKYTISLDAMGGDIGPEVVIPAAISALGRFDDINLVLVGDESIISESLRRHQAAVSERLRIEHATQVVEMGEAPKDALRKKKDSSMRVSINQLKSGEADACVSAGNTGALMATARFVLKMLPGVSRPAICTAIPSQNGHTHLLDLGANIDSGAEHLYQFAVMGAALVEVVDNNSNPAVGVLNVGQESIKGNPVVKEAHQLLSQSKLNYVGFVEGNDIYTGNVDVIVCDGFVGNVALKTSEGLAKMISTNMKAEFLRNPLTRLAGLIAMPVLKAFRRGIDHRRYNGASMLGLNGVVIKSHGGIDAVGFENAIKIARIEARQNIPQHIRSRLEQVLLD